MNNIEFFHEFFIHDNRLDFTAMVDIRYSSKPGFELKGHGQENEGFGYRHYLLNEGEFYGIRDNKTRNKWDGLGVTSITESSGFEDFNGLMDRYFGSVLVHIALEQHVKITANFISNCEIKASVLPENFVSDYGYLGKGRGKKKTFIPETIYDDAILKLITPPNKKAVVDLTPNAEAVLMSLPYELSKIMDYEQTFEYTSEYHGKDHTRKFYF